MNCDARLRVQIHKIRQNYCVVADFRTRMEWRVSFSSPLGSSSLSLSVSLLAERDRLALPRTLCGVNTRFRCIYSAVYELFVCKEYIHKLPIACMPLTNSHSSIHSVISHSFLPLISFSNSLILPLRQSVPHPFIC